MPVTINGDGSIAGLSVGGLGSGVVNTATIASGAITSALMPAGSVVQTQNVTLGTQNSRDVTTTGSWLDNYNTASPAAYQQIEFTPKFASSKLLIHASGTMRYQVGTSGHAGYVQMRIIDATNSNTQVGYIRYALYSYNGGHNRDSGAWTCQTYINASSTNMRRYNCQYYFDGDQTYTLGNWGDSITVMEIAA